MLLEVYILFQVLAVIGLILVFYSEYPLTSVLTALTSGVLMVGAWNLDVGMRYVWDEQAKAYTAETILISTPYLPYINMVIFSLALVYFFYDLFNTISQEAPKLNNVATGKGEGLNKTSKKGSDIYE